jgi:hypothetical protein
LFEIIKEMLDKLNEVKFRAFFDMNGTLVDVLHADVTALKYRLFQAMRDGVFREDADHAAFVEFRDSVELELLSLQPQVGVIWNQFQDVLLRYTLDDL